MKVLVSAYACDPSRGGEFNNGWGYAYNAINGISIWCITTTEGKEAIERYLKSYPISTLRMIYVEIPSWIQWTKDRFANYGVYFHYWYFQHRVGKVASQLEKEIHFDVVHHATYSSLQLGSSLWRLEKPMLFGPIGGGQKASENFKKYFSKWWSLERQRNIISFLLLRIIGAPSRVLKAAGITLVVNQETFEMARIYGARDIKYAPCTLLPDSFGPPVIRQREKNKTLRLLWVGRLIARKGLLVVLEALSQLDNSIPFTLTIIGDGEQKNEIQRCLEEFNLVNRVTLEGYKPLALVKEAYASHDLFIYCSLRESFASQIFESMSFGLPAILFNIHGVKTFIPDSAAWKIEVTEPIQTMKDIRLAIEYLYHHPEKRQKLGEQAHRLVQEFTWSKRIRGVNDLYNQLAASGLSVPPQHTGPVS